MRMRRQKSEVDTWWSSVHKKQDGTTEEWGPNGLVVLCDWAHHVVRWDLFACERKARGRDVSFCKQKARKGWVWCEWMNPDL